MLAFTVPACTVLFPTVGMLRARGNADVFLDDQGCQLDDEGRARRPCMHPGPVDTTATIGNNVLVGFLIDTALFLLLRSTVEHINDNTGA